MAEGRYRMHPKAPATQHFTRVAGEIWAQYLTTNTQEEIDEMVAKAQRHREMSRQIQLQVRPVVRDADERNLTPGTDKQET